MTCEHRREALVQRGRVLLDPAAARRAAAGFSATGKELFFSFGCAQQPD
jgi:hypothetical protein